MSFVNYLKRQSEGDDPFLALESDMSEALEQEFAAEAIPAKAEEATSAAKGEARPAQSGQVITEAPPEATEGPERLTSNSKKFLAGFDLYEARFLDSQAELKELGEKVASLTVTQHLTRDFLNLMQSSIYNANEMELNNKDLHAKNRALASQLDSARSLNVQQKASFEEVRNREAALQQERERLRTSLTAVNEELDELRKEGAANDAELAELRRDLTAKTTLSEKMARDNELVREKNINLSVDLDSALKGASELRRKHDEVSTNLKSTSAEMAEAMSQLSEARAEVARLGREMGNQSSRLTENAEALRAAELERDEAVHRLETELQTAKNEIQSLDTRFQAASREQASATDELIAVKLKLNDSVSEKRVAEEKLVALSKELESERREHGVASTKLSELNLERASEHVVIETAQQQLKEQQAEIDRLKAEVKRLVPFERLYRRKKDEMTCSADVETTEKADVPETDTVATEVASASNDSPADAPTPISPEADEEIQAKVAPAKQVAAAAKRTRRGGKSGKTA